MSTHAASLRPAPPAGYLIERERGALIVALPSAMAAVRAAVRSAGSLYEAAASAPAAQSFRGRGAAYRMPHDGGDWVVRHYCRGGAAARVLRDTYVRLGEPRPLRELRASVAARSRGVATPEVVAAVVYPASAFYRADLATRFVPDARDLADVTFDPGDGRAASDSSARDEGARVAAWRAAGLLLCSAFAAGVHHADLSLRNILVRVGADARSYEYAGQAWLLDLDRAVVRDDEVSDVARSRMLERLHRSRRKLEQEHARAVPAAALAAFAAVLDDADV